ncbi:MAG: tetratricopeptide repeat protein [Acidimicrobiales bacterium]
MNPDERTELEQERTFLLRSLADLEREHEAGDIDEGDHATLRDGYTARAAAVLRAIDDEDDVVAATATRGRGRVALFAAVVVVAAIAAGVLVARSAGQRTGTDTITGGITESVSRKLAEARSLLGTDHTGAIKRYDEVLLVDPANVEALTYKGWLLVQDGDDKAGGELIDKAIATQPDYADAHFFKGFVLVNVRSDPAAALKEFDIVLKAKPNSDIGQGAAQLADKAVGALLDAARSTLTSDPVKAAKTYDTVLDFDPENPEANAYFGFLLAQAGNVDDGLARIDRSIKSRGDYPDAHYLKASLLLNAKADPRGAIAELDLYLSLKPGPDGVDQANVLRAQAEAKLTEPSTAPTTSTTLTP